MSPDVAPPLTPEPEVGAAREGGGQLWLHGVKGWFAAWVDPALVKREYITWEALWARYNGHLIPWGPADVAASGTGDT